MPNRLNTVVVTAALAFCGQALAQYPVTEPTERSPNLSPVDPTMEPDRPAERVAPKSDIKGFSDDHKTHKPSVKKKPKPSKKTAGTVTTPGQ